MPHAIDKIFDDALAMPVADRVILAEKLLASLNPSLDPHIEQLWAKEAERRLGEIERGEARLVPAEEVFDEVRRRLAK
jgi:putative addiction module component (TIGR02574 family)